jgi:hypothetical protein
MKSIYVPSFVRIDTKVSPWNRFYKQILNKKEQGVDNKRKYHK